MGARGENLVDLATMNLRVTSPTLRLLTAALVAMTAPACGDSGSATGTDTTTVSTTAPSTGPSTSEPGTSEPGTSTTGTSTTVTSGASAEPTTGGTGTTVDTSTGVTGTTDGTGTTATTGEGTSSTSSTGEPGTSTGEGTSSTGADELMPCVTDKDCALADDCCQCEALNPGESVTKCDVQECLVSTCTSIGLDNVGVECRLGRCMFTRQTCNPLSVDCDAPKPMCAPGDVPTVEDTNGGKCWTGACVPAEACDWVPDCSYCADDELVCVAKLQKGAYKVCEARPLDCPGGDIDCGCGQQICDASPPHTICQDVNDGIGCECPFC